MYGLLRCMHAGPSYAAAVAAVTAQMCTYGVCRPHPRRRGSSVVIAIQEQLRARNHEAAILLALREANRNERERAQLWGAWEGNEARRRELEAELAKCG